MSFSNLRGLLGRWLLWCLLSAGTAGAWAQPGAPVDATRVAGSPLGPHALYLEESSTPLDLAGARAALAQGAFRPDARAVASFGIGARPVWIHLRLANPSTQALTRELLVGMTWIDHIDAWLVQDGRTLVTWRTGDAVASAPGVVPAQGFVWRLMLPPGHSEVWIRAETSDPMVLPLRLSDPESARAQQRNLHHGYGALYGFLAACIVFSAILFAVLRTRNVLFYGLYLLSFVFMNLCYTGHGAVWWWSDLPQVQRFVVLASMVVFACCGFLFVTRFLEFQAHAPVVQRWVDRGCLAALALMGLSVLAGSQLMAAYLAFNMVIVYTVGMVALGVYALRVSRAAGRYLLGAALFGAAGAASSALSTWGWLPMNEMTFRGVEFGVLVEATLLVVALALRARELEHARLDAERLARTDPLTGLWNRRAFLERAELAWAVAQRRSRPISALMLDIDHFKAINDQHGHDGGDRVLAQAAQVLAQNCRAGDIPARWGGEEFVVLLPDTGADQAQALAERLRAALAATRIEHRGRVVPLTASVGVVQRTHEHSLSELMEQADQWLYFAKRSGRNRVAAPPEPPQSPAANEHMA